MGTNEFGLTIGNEALWTKEPYHEEDDALLGMDILRLALERARTADEALEVILELLEKYGQGGNCNFYHRGYYHNAFLIADADNGWVLETAGEYWAAEKVKGVRSISNTMTVHKYDRIHPEAISHAIAAGYCKDEADFDFTEAYLDKTEKWTGSGINRQCITTKIMSDEEKVSPETMFKALRSHDPEHGGEKAWYDSYYSPCMHAAGDGDAHSSASLIAVIRPEGKSTYWGTDMSIPCIAPFKPFWFDAYAEDVVFPYEKQEEAMDAWLKREEINRAFVDGRIDEKAYMDELHHLEAQWKAECSQVEGKDAATRKAFCEKVSAEEKRFIDKWLDYAKSAKANPKGNAAFQEAWQTWNERKGQDRRIAK